MLILGWTTNDWRGPKTWAAYWSSNDTPALRDDARRYIAECNLANGVICDFPNDTAIETAKRETREHVCLVAFVAAEQKRR